MPYPWDNSGVGSMGETRHFAATLVSARTLSDPLDRSTTHVVLDNRSPSHFPTATSFAVPSQLVVVISPRARTPINMKLSVKFIAVHHVPKEDGTPLNMFVRWYSQWTKVGGPLNYAAAVRGSESPTFVHCLYVRLSVDPVDEPVRQWVETTVKLRTSSRAASNESFNFAHLPQADPTLYGEVADILSGSV
ncbi:hypothetical protein HDU88_000104 [Geranomyces variabilis]|nr:hypothetical protein HDU88_000104 [Geranomyces variabilis]